MDNKVYPLEPKNSPLAKFIEKHPGSLSQPPTWTEDRLVSISKREAAALFKWGIAQAKKRRWIPR